MKVKNNFALRNIAGTTAVFPLGDNIINFTGMLTLNESGVILWNLLERGCTKEDLVNALLKEYDVSNDVALADVEAFISRLSEVGCIDLDA